MIPAEKSLLHYMQDSGLSEHYPVFMESLQKQDVEIPHYLRHTLAFSRRADERLKLNKHSASFGAEDYPELVEEEIYTAYRSQASKAEMVTQENHPRLLKMFHLMCDQRELRCFGPNRNEYPRLVLIHSDTNNAYAFYSPPSVMLTTQNVESLSPRFIYDALSHELAHLKEGLVNPSLKTRLAKALLDSGYYVRQEYNADIAGRHHGICGEDGVDHFIEGNQLFMRKKLFAQHICDLATADLRGMAQKREEPFTSKLPYFLQSMLTLVFHKPYLREKGSFLTRWKNEKEGHPATQARIEHLLANPPDKKAEEAWQRQLEHHDFRGDLLGR